MMIIINKMSIIMIFTKNNIFFVLCFLKNELKKIEASSKYFHFFFLLSFTVFIHL